VPDHPGAVDDHGTDTDMTIGAGRTPLRFFACLGVAAVAVAALSACQPGDLAGGSASAAPSAPVTAGPSGLPASSPSAAPTETMTATAMPTSSPTPSASASAADNEYLAAKKEWKAGSSAISAEMGAYWAKAAADLAKGETTDTGDTSAYPLAITGLKELISLPDAQQTPAQNAAYHADILALNGFFMTPGLYQ
jgi:hypothetical protein